MNGLKIPVVGMDQFVDKIPDGTIILFEGGLDNLPSYLVQSIGDLATSERREVTYITSKSIQDVTDQVKTVMGKDVPFYIIESVKMEDWPKFMRPRSVMIVDSFSYLVLEKDIENVKKHLEIIRKLAKENKGVVLLLSHRGLLNEHKEEIARYLSDGIVQFHTKDMPEGIVRYMRFPKWTNGKTIDLNIFYNYENKRFNVDLRSRVI